MAPFTQGGELPGSRTVPSLVNLAELLGIPVLEAILGAADSKVAVKPIAEYVRANGLAGQAAVAARRAVTAARHARALAEVEAAEQPTVSDPDELPRVQKEALAVVRDGRSAVVRVHLPPA